MADNVDSLEKEPETWVWNLRRLALQQMKRRSLHLRMLSAWIGHAIKYSKRAKIIKRLANAILASGTSETLLKLWVMEWEALILMNRCGLHIGLVAEVHGTQKVAEGHIIEECIWTSTKRTQESILGLIHVSRHTSQRIALSVGIRKWKSSIAMMMTLWLKSSSISPRILALEDILVWMIYLPYATDWAWVFLWSQIKCITTSNTLTVSMEQPRNTLMMDMETSIYPSKTTKLTFYRFVKWWNMSVQELMDKNEIPPPQDPAAATAKKWPY